MKTARVEAPLVHVLTLELEIDLERGQELAKELRDYLEDMNVNAEVETDLVSFETISNSMGRTEIALTFRGLKDGEDEELVDCLVARVEHGCAWGDQSDALEVFDFSVFASRTGPATPRLLHLVK